MMSPFFSVIIPVYNVAAYLQRAVRSVQNQEWTDWEIVLVDDGSTDGSSGVCDELAAQDGRIKVCHQQNQGVVSARQNGFRVSGGDWILFLDGDDEIVPGLLQTLHDCVAQKHLDIVRFGFEMGGSRESMRPHLPKHATGLFTVANLIEDVVKTPLEITEMCIGDKLYRRSVCQAAFDDVGDVRIKHSEDGLFALAALLYSETFLYLDHVGYRYFLHEGSAVTRFNVELADEKLAFLNRALKLLKQSQYYSFDLHARMRSFHSYESLVFIFCKLLQWKGTACQVIALLRSTNACAFESAARSELVGLRRKGVAFLMRHPMWFLAYRLMSKVKRSI